MMESCRPLLPPPAHLGNGLHFLSVGLTGKLYDPVSQSVSQSHYLPLIIIIFCLPTSHSGYLGTRLTFSVQGLTGTNAFLFQ